MDSMSQGSENMVIETVLFIAFVWKSCIRMMRLVQGAAVFVPVTLMEW
jgi:hypothetical protein